MSEKLRFFDPQLKEKPEIELFNEPEWLIHLRQLDGQIRVKKTEDVCFCLHIIYLFTQSLSVQRYIYLLVVFKGAVSHLFPFCFPLSSN